MTKPSSLSQTLITGVYRTGSEFFAHTIGGHPALAARMYNIDVMKWAYRQYDPIEDPANARRALADIAERNRLRYDFTIDIEAIERAYRACGAPGYGTLYDVLMTELFCNAEKRHWAEKCQLLWREIPDFLRLMPNGRVILILRDPRSVLASFKKFTFVPPPAYLGAVFNCFDAMKHAKRYAAELPADRFLVVRYEDCAAAPEAEARRVYAFLGLDPSRAVYDPASWGQDGVAWRANTAFQAASELFDTARSLQRWRENLDDDEIAFTEAVCGPLMGEFGYAPAGTRLDWPGVLRRFIDNEQIAGWFKSWLLRGEGAQAYPLDPRNPANWAETQSVETYAARSEGEKVKRLKLVESGAGRYSVAEADG